MAHNKGDFDRVRTLGLSLPGAVEGTAYGSPALRVRRQLLTCLAVHKSPEPATLVVRVGFDQRCELLKADPLTYYVTDHYLNYPAVLVRLSQIQADALRDLLRMAWRFVTAKAKRNQRPRARRSRSLDL